MSVSGAASRQEPPGPHLSEKQVTALLAAALPPDELLAVDDHLAACPACRERMRERWSPEPALAAWREVVAEPRPRLRAFPPLILRHRAAWIGMAAAAVAIAGLILAGARLGWWRSGGQEALPTPEVAVRPPAPGTDPPAPDGPGREGSSPEAPARLLLADGERRIELTADGTLRGLEQLAAPWPAVIAEALVAGRLAVPASVMELGGRPPTLRGEGDPQAGPRPLSPLATAVANARPTFRWAPLPGAEAHRVAVFDQRYREVAASGWLAAREWTPDQALPRGAALSWLVTARREGREVTGPSPASPEARFLVLTRERAARMRADLEGAAGSRLARAAIYAEAGLLAKAAAELTALAPANPDSEVLRSLRASLNAPQGASEPAPSPTNTSRPSRTGAGTPGLGQGESPREAGRALAVPADPGGLCNSGSASATSI